MAKRIIYSEPLDYFPKSLRDELLKDEKKKTAKKTAKKSAGKTSKKK